jgi:RND superfamily putative drug exporter
VRAFGLVLLGIFLVLTLMLRSLIAPIYLIATVVLSFSATLGVTNIVYQVVFGVDHLAWWMPFFTFVFLVALGIDYNIFLVGRMKEEVAHYGLHDGMYRAVSATGPIIGSAGIILAGTFVAMMAGEIKGLAQIGFAVSFGVIVEAFVVRPLVVPALTTLCGKWAWWPGGIPTPKKVSVPKSVSAIEPGD